MTSLFLRMFLWFCGIAVVIAAVIIVGFLRDSPAALLTNWRDFGHRAIQLTAHEAANAYQQGGTEALSRRLQRVGGELGVRAALLDDAGRDLAATGFRLDTASLEALQSGAEQALTIADRSERIAGVRVRARGGRSYIFAVALPPRESGVWGRAFVLSFFAAGALLCYLLARSVASPVAHLRQFTRQFSSGDLSVRVTKPAILARRDEIGELARDFNQMAIQIENLMDAQRRLIADVAHELRSPMTRLGLALGLMRRAAPSADAASLARVSRELERLNALTAMLLTLSRLESMGGLGPKEAVDLAVLIRDVADDASFEARSLKVSVRLTECEASTVDGTPELVRSAIENVVRNALKHTGPETEIIVQLKYRDERRLAEILVQDGGTGVPESELTQIFEPFYRLDAARDPHTGGAGLGLAITRRIMHLHGGTVTAANRAGGGLEVRLTFPARRQARLYKT